MNVRFAPHEVRFRITRPELEQLQSGRALVMNVGLPGQHAFQASVTTDRFGAWRLDSDPTGLWLAIPGNQLDALVSGAVGAEGLKHQFDLANGGTLALNFEVDVRS